MQKMASSPIDTIVFDLGGVLVDWNPEYLYRKIFPDPEQRAFFLTNICSPEWNAQQDGGRTIAEANALLSRLYPEYHEAIHSFYDRWEEMFQGSIQGTLDIFHQLIEHPDYRVYALTNWSAETWDRGRKCFPYFDLFDGVLVSGQENRMKPQPEIYRLLLERFQLDPQTLVFFDDNEKNIIAAQQAGWHAFVFQSPEQLKITLQGYGVAIR